MSVGMRGIDLAELGRRKHSGKTLSEGSIRPAARHELNMVWMCWR